MEPVNPVTTIGTQDKSPQATTAAAVAGAVPATTPWGPRRSTRKLNFPQMERDVESWPPSIT